MPLSTLTRPALLPLLRTARPRQWVKNVPVVAAPLAAGIFVRPASFIALAAFVLASSATYCINDTVDVEADRRHPVKFRRPVAAGLLPTRTARLTAIATGAAALLVAAVAGPGSAGVTTAAHYLV